MHMSLPVTLSVDSAAFLLYVLIGYPAALAVCALPLGSNRYEKCREHNETGKPIHAGSLSNLCFSRPMGREKLARKPPTCPVS